MRSGRGDTQGGSEGQAEPSAGTGPGCLSPSPRARWRSGGGRFPPIPPGGAPWDLVLRPEPGGFGCLLSQ